MQKSSWELTWEPGDATPVRAADELDRLIRPLIRERDGELPILIMLSAPDGKWMSIALDEPSVATFQYGIDPPYFLSAGSPSSAGKPLLFSFQGHETEFEPAAAIPLDDALQGLRAFFMSGEQPTNIEWKEV
jgi:hypothetical protein